MEFKKDENDLSVAISIAAEAFVGRYDKGGNPYILHCLYVMNKVAHLGNIAMIVAVLHDLLEDTEWTAEQLRKIFSDDVVHYIEILTHKEGEPYELYIGNAGRYTITRAVKMADLEHNSQIFRMKGLGGRDFKRLEKYFHSYNYLKNLGD